MGELRFLLDENISHRLYLFLKRKRFLVNSIHGLNLNHIKNGDLFDLCVKSKSILVTFDKDFLNISNKQHYGILLLNIHPVLDSVVIPVINNFFSDPAFMQINWIGKIIILKNNGFEIRE